MAFKYNAERRGEPGTNASLCLSNTKACPTDAMRAPRTQKVGVHFEHAQNKHKAVRSPSYETRAPRANSQMVVQTPWQPEAFAQRW